MRLLFLFLLLVSAPIALACIVPENGMRAEGIVELCSGVFYLDKGIVINSSNVLLSCNEAVLKSWAGGVGISITSSSNVTVKNCQITGYDIGFRVRNSTWVFLHDNHLLRNNIGTIFSGVNHSAILNNDVSLRSTLEVISSSNNALSFTNKFIRNSFCRDNFCNLQKEAVFIFMRPQTTGNSLQNWLLGQFDNSEAKFKSWVFEGII